MPSGGRFLFLIIVSIIGCSSLVAYWIVRPTLDGEACSSCSRQPSIKPLGHLVYHVREDSKEELVAVTKNWQRWAEFAPCRPSSSPTNWESGQVPLTIIMSSANFTIDELLFEAWNNLPDRVRWCFLEPKAVVVQDLGALSSGLNMKAGTYMLADADFWPVTENWLNIMSLQAMHISGFRAMGHQLADGSILPQAIYNAENKTTEYMAINDMIGSINGSVHEYRRHHPEAVFVIAQDGAIFDDF